MSHIINRGIGFNPGSLQYEVTLGLTMGAAITPFRVISLTGTYTPTKTLTGTYVPSHTLTGN